MKKLFIGLNIALYSIAVILVMVFGFVFKFGIQSFKYALFCSMISGFLGLVVALFSTLKKVELRRLTCAIHATIVFVAVVMYYLFTNFLEYDTYKVLLWSLYLGITVVAVSVLMVLNYKLPQRKLVVKK